MLDQKETIGHETTTDDQSSLKKLPLFDSIMKTSVEPSNDGLDSKNCGSLRIRFDNNYSTS